MTIDLVRSLRQALSIRPGETSLAGFYFYVVQQG